VYSQTIQSSIGYKKSKEERSEHFSSGTPYLKDTLNYLFRLQSIDRQIQLISDFEISSHIRLQLSIDVTDQRMYAFSYELQNLHQPHLF
jgi:hypothetical protein